MIQKIKDNLGSKKGARTFKGMIFWISENRKYRRPSSTAQLCWTPAATVRSCHLPHLGDCPGGLQGRRPTALCKRSPAQNALVRRVAISLCPYLWPQEGQTARQQPGCLLASINIIPSPFATHARCRHLHTVLLKRRMRIAGPPC